LILGGERLVGFSMNETSGANEAYWEEYSIYGVMGLGPNSNLVKAM
jgi:hypothetical protein